MAKPSKKSAATNSAYFAEGQHLKHTASEYEKLQAKVRADVDEFIGSGGEIQVIPTLTFDQIVTTAQEVYSHG